MLNAVLVVFRKEWHDALRDRRAWLVALTVALFSGPAVLLLISSFISNLENQVAQRLILLDNPHEAPTLVNYLQRMGATVQRAPNDYRLQLRSGQLQNAVFVVKETFEETLAQGAVANIDVYYDASHDKARAAVQSAIGLVRGFNQELGVQRLIARGVSPQLLAAISLNENDLAPTGTRGAQLLFIIPWTALLIAVYGTFSTAIDVTAGERERGSLEPLLANPLHPLPLIVGKWGVVTLIAWVIIVLTLFGFLIAMRFISSDTLSALMQLQWKEIFIFAIVLMPFAGLMASINMLVATFGRTYKEAQTYVSYIAMAVQFGAVIPIFLTTRDQPWQLVVPPISQLSLMLKSLRGEPLETSEILLPLLLCTIGVTVCLFILAHLLRKETIVFARS